MACSVTRRIKTYPFQVPPYYAASPYPIPSYLGSELGRYALKKASGSAVQSWRRAECYLSTPVTSFASRRPQCSQLEHNAPSPHPNASASIIYITTRLVQTSNADHKETRQRGHRASTRERIQRCASSGARTGRHDARVAILIHGTGTSSQVELKSQNTYRQMCRLHFGSATLRS